MTSVLGSGASRRLASGNKKHSVLALPGNSLGAFTLVELLAVMTMITVLSVLTLPAIFSLSNAESLNQSVSDLSLLLNQSRAYAMAHDTYVWVGFVSDATAQNVTVGIVAGQTGEITDISANSSQGNALTFGDVIQFDPQGEASLNKTGGSSNWIQIGLQPLRGASKETANKAAFQIATLTGQVITFRP
jgi:type II secretory pathway pseudopilin PulG